MLTLVITNLARRRLRTALTAVGIAAGVATVVALLALTAGLERSAGGLVHLGNAEMGLFQAGVTDLTASSLPASLVERVRAQEGVADASPVQVMTDERPEGFSLLVFGVVPGSFVAERMVVTAGAPPRGEELALGEAAAARLGIRPGASLALRGERFRVAALYRAGVEFQDAGAVLPLATVQRLAQRPDDVTTIAVGLRPNEPAETMSRRLERVLPGVVAVSDPRDVARAGGNTLLINRAVVVIAVLALLVGGISVMNTMLLSVTEREAELGLLCAVGWSRGQVGRVILAESVGVSLLGAALGLGLGVVAGEVAVRALGASALVSPQFTAAGLARGLLVGVAIGVAGGLYPAWRVTRMRPAQALARA